MGYEGTENEEIEEIVNIMALPISTRFYVNNGAWYGRIGGTPTAKTVFVEASGETYPLTEDVGLDITVVDDDDKYRRVR